MTSATHYAFSYLVCSAAGVPPGIALPASLVALLPDIDHPQSLVGRIFPFVSKYLLRKYGHRTVTHSLFAALAVAMVLSPALFFSGAVYGAVVLAFGSHIFIDLFNRSGVKLLAPFSQKEYISFRTPELRIIVSSWKEYVVLFVIVFLAFTVTGEAFSLTRAVRSVSKLFYRHYDGAVTDYQNNSEYLCTARVEYFNHTTTRMVTEYFIVLNMYSEKMYGLRIKSLGETREIIPSREGRTILKKADINEIEVTRTARRMNTKILSGSSLSDLAEIPAGFFVSGTIVIKNYNPELKNTDYIRLDHTPSSSSITITCAMPQELGDIIRLDKEREREIRSLKSKTSAYQIDRLNDEEASIKRRLIALQRKGFYENYLEINRLNSELKKVEARIDTLKMREASGGDVDTLMKIEKMEKDFSVEYKLYLFQL
jgi:inner membrane protein